MLLSGQKEPQEHCILNQIFTTFRFPEVTSLISVPVSRELKICDHDLDHFFHDRELIAIRRENDRDLLNFLMPRSWSFGHLFSYIYSLCQNLSLWLSSHGWLFEITDVKQYWAESVLGWVIRWGKYSMLSICASFSLFFFLDKMLTSGP